MLFQLYEHAMYNQVTEYLEHHNVADQEQQGFYSGK